MPTLENPPFEVLAHARSRGAPLTDADKWDRFAPAKVADWGEIAKDFSCFVELQIRRADPVDA
jgi:hypothetical protein